jgi:hypothetical protein
MNIMKTLKQVLYNACLYYTAAEFLLLFIATGYKEMNPEAGGGVGLFLSLGSSALIFLACLIMSGLNLIFRLDYSMSVRVLLHFIGALIAYAIVFIFIPGAFDVAQIMVRMIVFAGIYLIIAFIALIIASMLKNKKTEKFEYESQFTDFSHRK